ncbi:unnamed protein product [Spirodela intermedia]|uniref:Uncharacterized protein n=1 Tax=Spirodela intermedia TaxID=51605 RepID=A0A7I8IYY1_SPIIN|nr:unnamed protein product [Spirodela intermedia]CAA6663174.1 unnamed protein product [Spirodela intermedia]
MALRDLPVKTRTAVAKEREEPLPDITIIPGSKRHLSERPLSPLHPSVSCSSPNGHLVYVRRKVEDSGRGGTRDDMEMAPSAKSSISHRDEMKRLSYEQEHSQEPKSSHFQSFLLELTCTAASTGGPAQAHSPSPSRVHWKERFLRLQTFLEACDQADQEEYIQSKELKRMQLLNVLGKISPNQA